MEESLGAYHKKQVRMGTAQSKNVDSGRVGRKKMRKRFAVMVVGACICFPVAAQETQQKNGDSSATTNAVEAPKTNLFGSAASVSKSPWALPAKPKMTPFPGPADTNAKKSSGDDAPGQLTPRYELSGGYSYIDFHPGDPFSNFGNQGGTGSFAFNFNRVLGMVAEIGSYNYTRNVSGTQRDGDITTYMFGPRLNLRKFDHFVPFAEFLFGGARSGNAMTGGSSQDVFSLATGGGVDVVFNKNFAWRFAQIDYLLNDFSGVNVGSSARQNNLRLGTGLVLRWGFPAAAPPPSRWSRTTNSRPASR